MAAWVRVACLAIGYALGLFQTGYLYGRLHHIDIREHGSGNAGTTNTLRTLGWKAGAVTFFGDLAKAMLAILAAWLLFHDQYPDTVMLLEMYAGLGAVLGHNYPCYLRFKGGKGIACTSGFILAVFPQAAPLCLVLFILTVAATKYVSLGSILVAISFYAQLAAFGQLGFLRVGAGNRMELYIVGAVFSLLALWRHRANIRRLLTGTENKFGMGKKEA